MYQLYMDTRQVSHKITQARHSCQKSYRNRSREHFILSYRFSFFSETPRESPFVISVSTLLNVVSRAQRRHNDKTCEKGADKSRAFRNPVRLFGQHAIPGDRAAFTLMIYAPRGSDNRYYLARAIRLPASIYLYRGGARCGAVIKTNLRHTRKGDTGSNKSDRVA